MLNNEIPPRPSIEQMTDAALSRAGLRDRRKADITEPPYQSLGDHAYDHMDVGSEMTAPIVPLIIVAAILVIGISAWVLL